jgi:putative transposase
MSRHLRVEYPGAIYHVTCRMVGNWQTDKTFLFKDGADHERFVDRLGERVEQFNIRLYLFVWMTNHCHLVFETPEADC